MTHSHFPISSTSTDFKKFLFQNRPDLKNEADLINTLKEGTEDIDQNSVEFDQTVRSNVDTIINSVHQAEVKKIAEQAAENQEEFTESPESTEKKPTPESPTEGENHPQKEPPKKKGFFARAKESVGTFIGKGMKYGALVEGIIGLGYGVFATAILMASGATSFLGLPVLAAPAIYGLGGAIGGLFHGGIIGAIVGLVKKSSDKKERT